MIFLIWMKNIFKICNPLMYILFTFNKSNNIDYFVVNSIQKHTEKLIFVLYNSSCLRKGKLQKC